jgi:hypothetical protein
MDAGIQKANAIPLSIRIFTRVEMILLGGTLIGFLVAFIDREMSVVILNVFMSFLTTTYMVRAIFPGVSAPRTGHGFKDVIARLAPRGAWYGVACIMIGVTFVVIGFPTPPSVVEVGFTLTVASLAAMFLVMPKPRSALMPVVYRAIPICIVGLYLLLNNVD